jgi:hypothetical protein
MKKINKRSYGLLFLIAAFQHLAPVYLTAQNVMGAKHMAMGQTGTAVPLSNWSVFSNIALIPTNDNHVSFYGFRYAGIAEITDMAAAFSYNTAIGTMATGIHRYGFNLFSENRFLLGYKNHLGNFHYGASFVYAHVNQYGSYGSAGAIGVNIGLAAEVFGGLWFGARATNINQPAYGDTDETLPRELAAGISYRLTPETIAAAELVKDVLFPISFRSGVQVEMITSFYARAGITTQPETYSLGFGYMAERWDVNIAVQQHNPLGLSPAFDLGIRF